VVIGVGCGTSLNSGSRNVIIGNAAGTAITSTNDNIFIASAGSSGEGGVIRIGTAATHTTCYIQGISGNNISSSVGVFITASGQLGTVSSSLRYKKNIEPVAAAVVNAIDAMQVKSFHYNPEPDTAPVTYGMIAEEMEQVLPGLVIYKDAQPETIQYHLLVPLLVAYVQDLKKRIAVLEANNR
jgi:hypothetical protein